MKMAWSNPRLDHDLAMKEMKAEIKRLRLVMANALGLLKFNSPDKARQTLSIAINNSM